MIGNKDKFNSLITPDEGKVKIGDNAMGKAIGKGKVGRMPSCFIDHVLLVERLKRNFFSIR